MKSYRRLTREHRYQIYALKESGLSIRSISKILRVSPSTISRELKRLPGAYAPTKSHKHAEVKRQTQKRRFKITGSLKEQIDLLIQQQWSPEQISGRLELSHIHISHESIYRYIYREKEWPFHKNLRRKHKFRRSRATTDKYKLLGIRKFQTSIEERPSVVEERNRVGDYERDLVLGKNSRILTIVDRTTKLLRMKKVSRLSGYEVHNETLELLKGHKVHTITNDNGTEFSLHDVTSKILNAQIFFARPYCSWQRGTIENTNGLIRQYYPKGTDFSQISDEELKTIEDKMNNRPRKKLGYLTPYEVHQKLSQGVALGS